MTSLCRHSRIAIPAHGQFFRVQTPLSVVPIALPLAGSCGCLGVFGDPSECIALKRLLIAAAFDSHQQSALVVQRFLAAVLVAADESADSIEEKAFALKTRFVCADVPPAAARR